MFSLGYLLPDAVIDSFHPLIKHAMAKKLAWDTMEEAEEYFRGRRLFQTFDEGVMQAWLKEGLRTGKNCGRIKLVFDGKREACMYKTTPTETRYIGSKNGYMGQYDAINQKGVFLYSTKFDFLNDWDVTFLKSRFTNFDFQEFHQGHFFPLQDPTAFAEKVADHIIL